MIKEVKGIDILISAQPVDKSGSFVKVDNTLLLKPSWEGRRLGKAVISVEKDKIINHKVEEVRLSNQIKDDPGISSILPQCFSDANCRKGGIEGVCRNAGGLNSACLFEKVNEIKLLIISSKLCNTCNTESAVKFLKTKFPGAVEEVIYYPESKLDLKI